MRQLTRGSRRELRFFSAVPHPTLNTADSRANGLAYLLAVAHTISPIGRIEIPITLQLA